MNRAELLAHLADVGARLERLRVWNRGTLGEHELALARDRLAYVRRELAAEPEAAEDPLAPGTALRSMIDSLQRAAEFEQQRARLLEPFVETPAKRNLDARWDDWARSVNEQFGAEQKRDVLLVWERAQLEQEIRDLDRQHAPPPPPAKRGGRRRKRPPVLGDLTPRSLDIDPSLLAPTSTGPQPVTRQALVSLPGAQAWAVGNWAMGGPLTTPESPPSCPQRRPTITSMPCCVYAQDRPLCYAALAALEAKEGPS